MADDDKDDLRGDVMAAMNELSGGAPEREAPIVEREAPETDAQRVERERDETGRFKAKDVERPTLSLKEKPEAQGLVTPKADAANPPASGAPPALDGKVPSEPIPPPTEWKGAGKVKWDRLPREVQTELRDTWQAMASERSEIAPVKELIDVNREFLVNQAGSLPAAMTQLMQFARMSVDNPVGLIQHIARTTGTDLHALVSGQPSSGAPQHQAGATADIAQLVRQELQPIIGQFEQQRTNQVISQIEAFRADPKHPYFNDVAPRIEGLLKAGAAKDLQDAYDQAIWADPAIRQQLMSAQAEEAKRTQTAEAERARKAASASLRGSPLPGAGAGAGGQSGSVHDDVRAAMAEIAGA